jgi:hypothetical protein
VVDDDMKKKLKILELTIHNKRKHTSRLRGTRFFATEQGHWAMNAASVVLTRAGTSFVLVVVVVERERHRSQRQAALA